MDPGNICYGRKFLSCAVIKYLEELEGTGRYVLFLLAVRRSCLLLFEELGPKLVLFCLKKNIRKG
jgi:hypothetical protein